MNKMAVAYDKNGNEISMEHWGKLFTDKSYQRVALDIVDQYEVSTVWLGLDHSFGGDVPMIFESMIFAADHKAHNVGHDLYCDRYSTLLEAQIGHAYILAKLREGGLDALLSQDEQQDSSEE
jgi:hypothetical protein